MIADEFLEGVHLPGARQLLLDNGQGFCDVGEMAVNKELLYLNVKVMVVMTGFAEVEVEHPAMVNCVLAAMQKMLDNVDYQKIVVAAPVPRPDATNVQLKELFKLTKVIQCLCKKDCRLEFTRSGLNFYGPRGIYANLMTAKGLTQMGTKTVNNQLLDKLNSLGFARG